MICKKCNASIPEDSLFCPICGEAIQTSPDESQKTQAESTKQKPDKTPNKFKTIIDAQKIELIVGVICICVGIITLLTTTLSIESTSFGGDFYTYAYQGIYVATVMLTKLVRLVALLLVGLGTFLVRHSS